MKLLAHQKKYAKNYPDKGFLVHEGGTGKTICGTVWLKDGRDKDALVVCPKKVVRKWQNTLSDWGTKATVVSKEQFKKLPVKKWSAKVIDEADEFAAPLFVAKKRSMLATCMYALTKAYPDMPTLLLTATPIRSNPWNLHTLLCYLGIYIDWKEWRTKFFDLVYPSSQQYGFLDRPAYMPKSVWRTLIRPTLEKYADIVLLKDCVKELPSVTEEILQTPPFLSFVPAIDGKPFFDEHRHEQKNKPENIVEIGKEFRKVLVVAYYREQIIDLKNKLSKDKETFAIYGSVTDQEAVVTEAQESDECYLIVQADIGAGFDADSFSCVVFASMSYAVRSYVQMKFRVRRIHNLHPVKYFYLMGGPCDKAVFNNIKKGKNFVPSEYMNVA